LLLGRSASTHNLGTLLKPPLRRNGLPQNECRQWSWRSAAVLPEHSDEQKASGAHDVLAT